MSDQTLTVERRETQGKNSNRRLRASGQVPAVVYGNNRDPVNIQVGHRDVEILLEKTADGNPIFLLSLAGTDKKRHAMIRELHSDPISGHFLHIDFQRVDMDAKLRTSVHLELKGASPGVKLGGLLDFVTREVEIEALPADIPGHIDVDISGLQIGDHVEAKDLTVPEGVELHADPELVILSIQEPRAEEEEAGEGDELTEPEVIGQAAKDNADG